MFPTEPGMQPGLGAHPKTQQPMSENNFKPLGPGFVGCFWGFFSLTFSHRGRFGARSGESAQLGGVRVGCEPPTPEKGTKIRKAKRGKHQLEQFHT